MRLFLSVILPVAAALGKLDAMNLFDPYWNDINVRQIDRFEAPSEILMGRGPKPAGDPNAFDARDVIANIAPRVTR